MNNEEFFAAQSEAIPEDLAALNDAKSTVPRTIEQQATDVLEVGHLFAGGTVEAPSAIDTQTLTLRVRPVRPGFSVQLRVACQIFDFRLRRSCDTVALLAKVEASVVG